MCHALLEDASFWAYVHRIDIDIAAQVQQTVLPQEYPIPSQEIVCVSPEYQSEHMGLVMAYLQKGVYCTNSKRSELPMAINPPPVSQIWIE